MYALIQILVVALSGIVLAIPAPTKTTPLDKRTISGVTAADCDGFTFTSAQVAAAASAAATHIASGTTVGSNSYPHVFNNREGERNASLSIPAAAHPFTNSRCFVRRSILVVTRATTASLLEVSLDRMLRSVVGVCSASTSKILIILMFPFVDVITHYGATGNNFLQCDNA
ncbi:unnamed protein product [Rhizoctonia solani]|uniref:Uncharacterized protein n=1 Tax=Rhizoctonia solani TaxID=456999 RepID=A0A8H3C8A9_9AGAM|nr:unnamed protein product [Rhizoctonia solani]